MILRWLTSAALGNPVVPEVNTRSARSSSLTLGALGTIAGLIRSFAAVANAGALGFLTALTQPTPEDLVKEIAPLYQKMNGKSLKDTVEVAADDRANSLIVLSSESNYAAIEKLVSTLDTEDAQDKIMQAFPLKNADAQDVAKQLKDLAEDTGSSSRYPFYFFSSAPASSSKKMNVVADRRRNTATSYIGPERRSGQQAEILQQPSLLEKARTTG